MYKRKTQFVRPLCLLVAIAFAVTGMLTGCGIGMTNDSKGDTHTDIMDEDASHEGAVITDANGHEVFVKADARVVSLYGSFAECWLLAGGELVGVTKDAIEERQLVLSEDVQIVGTVKDPNLETIVSLNPDYVILSKDLTAHAGFQDSFEQLQIPYGYFSVDTFEDYDGMMAQFCKVSNRMDLYETNVTHVKVKIETIKIQAAQALEKKKTALGQEPTALLIRAYTTGVKAKADDNLAGIILKELGCVNIVDRYPSMLEDFSVEQVIAEDPDYIFVLTMGEEEKALAYLQTNVIENPAWNQLSAIKNQAYYVLPKELFHYKPNNHWDESYQYLAELLYAE